MEIKSSLKRVFNVDGYSLLPILRQDEHSLTAIESTNNVELLALLEIKEQIQTLIVICKTRDQQTVLERICLQDLAIFYELNYSASIIHFRYIADNRKSFRIEFTSGIDSIWFGLFLNQNTILQLSKDFPVKHQDTIAKPLDAHVSEISSEISYGDFLTPE